MSDRIVVLVGAALAVVPLLAAVIALRPRPATVREVVYVALPIAGAVVLAVLSWSRV
jgi:hypothetical protein